MNSMIFPLFLLFIATATFVYLVFMHLNEKKQQFRFEDDLSHQKEKNRKLDEGAQLLLFFKPAFKFLVPIFERIPSKKYQQIIKQKAIYAACANEFTCAEFMAFQVFLSIMFLLLAVRMVDNNLIILLAAASGAYFPLLWLQSKKKRRQEDIQASMPDIIDTLSLTMEAGLDLYAGLEEVCRIFENDPFALELQLMKKDINYGMPWYEALQNVADRVDLAELDAFVSIMIQAGKGASVAEVLKTQAARMRHDRFLNAEKEGAKASQKLFRPLMVCIFPLILMILICPLLIKFLTSEQSILF